MSDPCKDYAAAYRRHMLELDAPVTPYLVEGQYEIKGDRLLSIMPRPLQPNTRLLAETLYLLKPHSLAEFGSGCGVNLHNLSLLLPTAKLYGYELCQEQIDVMNEVFPGLPAIVWSRNITRPNYMPDVDVAFSHTVLMHLPDHAAIVAAIGNMLRTAQKQVVMLENFGSSNFANDLMEAHPFEHGWAEVHFYTRRSPELKRAHILIASKMPLPVSRFTPLVNYETELAVPVRENWMNDADKVFDRSWERV